ncbi:MAG: ATP-binding protein [Deltaproteobacteria bacterium]|nr:ATP-binding protein [Deltaproteobacteria bacterium]
MRDGPGRPYRRLRRQMLAALIAVGLLPLATVAGASLVAFQREIDARTRGGLEAIVKNRKATVELFLDEKLRQLQLCATSLPVAELSQPGVLEVLRREMQRERGGIIDLGLIGEDGRHLAYVGPYDLAGLDYRGAPWFHEVMVQGRYESDVFLGFRRFPHMVMAVKKREAGKDYVLRATIDTDLLSALVREGGLESGADVFVLNRAGEYQTQYSREHRLMEKADTGPIPVHSGVRLVATSRAGHVEHVATAWLRGHAWTVVGRQAAPGPWAIAGAQPTLLWLMALLLVAVVGLAFLIVRHRLRQFRGLEADHAALLEATAQSQKMAAIGRMAASVAHEINNPLAIIDAQVGVLTDALTDGADPPSRDELRDRLRRVAGQVQRGREVTHRLLGFSRRVGPSVEPVAVEEALDQTIGFVQQGDTSDRVKLVRHYAPEVPLIRSSLAQMQQVFLNLINNALDAIGEEGEVHLFVERSGLGVEVRIQDNGPGIAPTDLNRIFEPFFSNKSGTKTHSGLGLAICRDLMRSLNGRIDVSSTVGKGTTFSLWFPPEVPGD